MAGESLNGMKLEELAMLKDGWDSYDGKAPTAEAMKTVSYFTTVPLSNGGLQVEVHAGGADVEIEIDPDGNINDIYFQRRAPS